jgi:penicillin-binding protein 2
MRQALRQAIPSMFHRRLLLLTVGAVAALGVLLTAAARLTLGEASTNARAAAEAKLVVSELTPAVRGRILDRRGRVLAHDEPGWDVCVHYSVIDGSWSHAQARAAAREEAGDRWGDMTAEAHEVLIAEKQREYDRQVAELWTLLGGLGGLGPEQVEQRRTDIVERVQYMQAYLWDRWREELEQELDGEDVPLDAVSRPIAEQRQSHAVLQDVSDAVRQEVQGFIAEAETGREAAEAMKVWSRVSVRRPTQRRYPLETMTLLLDRSNLPPTIAEDVEQEITVEGVGVHLLGQTRKITAEDLDRLDRPYVKRNRRGQIVYDLGGYSARWTDDTVGSFGIEASMESALRGTRGKRIRHLDTNATEEFPAIAGHDVQLTIDIQLQARIAAIMSPQYGLAVVNEWHGSKAYNRGEQGEPLAGAAVVLEVETGELLAAVSHPPMPLRLLEDDPDAIYRDPELLPWLNRATMGSYQPGSTLKPIILLAADAAGAHPVGQAIRCEGMFDRDHPTRHRCWIYKQYMSQHGPLDAPTSLEVSCNVYYYTLGHLMGVGRTVDWYGRFGLGAPTGCGIEESAGNLPDPDTTPRIEAINMGIGQGPVGWTPVQAAAAYAAFARDGRYVSPTLIVDNQRPQPRERRDLKLRRVALDAALDGMHGVVYGSQGTGRTLAIEGRPKIFNAERITVFGKSGTAQTGDYRWIDRNLDEQVQPGERRADPDTHAWFVALVQPPNASRPTHAIVVVCEYAGKGSQVSGPIVNQIIHALQDEGYLPS